MLLLQNQDYIIFYSKTSEKVHLISDIDFGSETASHYHLSGSPSLKMEAPSTKESLVFRMKQKQQSIARPMQAVSLLQRACH